VILGLCLLLYARGASGLMWASVGWALRRDFYEAVGL
jgi:hypothetical protein